MLRVGLTGGIGCGKTTVAALFSACGVAVIDADVIAHRLLRPRSPALAQVIAAFGAAYLNRRGELNRHRLRQLVFSDAAARQHLEAILHPPIEAFFERRLLRLSVVGQEYVLCVVPLLLETGRPAVDRVLVVDCSEQEQRRRVLARDAGLTDSLLSGILCSQWSRQRRLAAADDVLSNDHDKEQLPAAVAVLDQQYKQLARTYSPRR